VDEAETEEIECRLASFLVEVIGVILTRSEELVLKNCATTLGRKRQFDADCNSIPLALASKTRYMRTAFQASGSRDGAKNLHRADEENAEIVGE